VGCNEKTKIVEMFYFQVFCILLLFASNDVDKKFNANSRNIVLFFLFLVFWLVAGLRYETGVDWPGYTIFFNHIDNITNLFAGSFASIKNSEFEIGFTLLNSALKLFTNNVQVLFLLIAFVTNIMLFISLKNYSSHIFVSLMIYFSTLYFITDMDVIRQCIALNIFFYSLKYIIDKSIYKYFLVIFIASLFHQTALLLLPMYFFLNKQFKISTLLILVGIVYIIFIFKIPWLRLTVGYLIDFISSGAFSIKLTSYLNNSSRIFGIGFIANLVVLVFALLKRKQLKTNTMFNLLLNMYVFNLIVYYSTWELSILSSRFRFYFLIGNIVLLTYFLDVYKEKLKKYVVFVFIIFYCLFYGRIYFFEFPEAISYNPYQNYFLYEIFDIKSTGTERRNIFMKYKTRSTDELRQIQD
jgi:transmembrane protein EpsG